MATFEDALLEQLTELVSAVKAKQTIVPLMFFVGGNAVNPESIAKISSAVREELRRAGFDLPTPPEE